MLRFDQNTPPLPLPSTRPGAIAGALARVNGYPGGGYRTLRRAIADYAGVEPENVVLGAGADDLILLCARAYAAPGDTIAIPEPPTYPLFRIAAQLAGADGRRRRSRAHLRVPPEQPDGLLEPLPDARPLVVDEAYFEYSGETALPLLDEGVVVLRTFSKLFALAGARIGYALASRDVADELNARQAPAPISSLSAALAVAALADPPTAAPVLEERERLASALRALGLAPLESHANFLYVPVDDGEALGDALLRQGIVVRCLPGRDPRLGARRARTTTCSSRRSRGCSTGRRRSPAAAGAACAHAARDRRDAPRGAARARRREPRARRDGRRPLRPLPGAARVPRRLRPRARRRGDLETGDHHTAEDAALAFGDGARRGARRPPRHRALRRRRRADGRRARTRGGRSRRAGARSELKLEPDPGLARHMLSSLAQAARASIHVEASGRDAHHVAEAAFKAVGRALRVAVRARGRRAAVDEGPAVRVAICDVRRRQRPLGRARVRAGSAPSSIDDVAERRPRGAARRRLGARRDGRACATRGHDVALRERVAEGRPVLGICLGLQLALDRTEEDGGVEGLGSCPAARCGCARVACRGSAGREVDERRRVLLRALLRRRDAARDRVVGGHRRRGARRARSSAASSTRRRAARRARATSRRARGGAIPLPRLIPCLDVAGRPRRQGRAASGPARRRRSRSSSARRTPTRAPTSSSSSTSRRRSTAARTLVELVRRVAERLAIPFTVGGGVRSVADAEALLAAGADKVAVNSAALARPELVTELAEQLGSQAVVVAIDAEGGRVRSRAGTSGDRPRRGRVGARGRGARRGGDPAHVDRRRRDARRATTCELTAAVADAVDVPVIASGGAGDAQHVADALEVAQAALLASILHEDPARLASLREELRELGVRGARCLTLRPAIVQDAATGRVLMLAWMDDEAERRTRETGEAWFWSRSREQLWRKGETSGNTLAVEELRDDCDGDALLAARRARPARRATPARSRASRPRSGARSPSARATGPRARTRPSSLDAGHRRAARARSARRRSSSPSPRSTRATSASSRRPPTSSTTSTCCSRRAASTSRRSRTSSRAGCRERIALVRPLLYSLK